MKIVFLTDQIFLHGGIEKVLTWKPNYFADVFGDEVYVVTTEQKGNSFCYNLSDRIKQIDLAIDYEREKSYFHPNNLSKVPHHFKRLKNVFEELKPDVIISSNYSFDFYFLPYISPKTPKIKEFHSSRYFNFYEKTIGVKAKLLKYLSKKAEQKYHQLVVLNPDEKKFYHSKKISVIPNPVYIPEEEAPLENHKLMAAGRISPVKNFGELIEIFAEIAPKFPDWELHFFGEDYLGTQSTLQKQIVNFGLQNKVKFLGSVENLQNTMLDYSVYTMTSKTECFPMVLLESLSVGLPIITYNSPTGPKHIVTSEQDSFLIPYEDKTIFKEKLSFLLKNEAERKLFGKKAKQNSHRFSEKVVMQQWRNLLVNLQNV